MIATAKGRKQDKCNGWPGAISVVEIEGVEGAEASTGAPPQEEPATTVLGAVIDGQI